MPDLLFTLSYLAIPVVLLAVGYFFGRFNERKHYEDIERREQNYASVLVTDLKTPVGFAPPGSGTLVIGQMVVASDYLKTFVASIKNLFGGELKSFATLMDRARREARLRMVEEAIKVGAVGVINVRYETSQIGASSAQGRGAAMSEVLCYGTAIMPG